MRRIENPHEIPVEFKLLDAKRDGLSSPVIAGTEQYIGAKVKRMPYAEEVFGYSFEMLVVYAQSLGIDLDKAEREIMAAYEAGVNYFDTAYVYPGSEAAIGKIFERNRMYPWRMIDKTALMTGGAKPFSPPVQVGGSGEGGDEYGLYG